LVVVVAGPVVYTTCGFVLYVFPVV